MNILSRTVAGSALILVGAAAILLSLFLNLGWLMYGALALLICGILLQVKVHKNKNLWLSIAVIFGASTVYNLVHLIFVLATGIGEYRLDGVIFYTVIPILVSAGIFIFGLSRFRSYEGGNKLTRLRLALRILLLTSVSLTISVALWPPQLPDGPSCPVCTDIKNKNDYRLAYTFGATTIILTSLNIIPPVATRLKNSS